MSLKENSRFSNRLQIALVEARDNKENESDWDRYKDFYRKMRLPWDELTRGYVFGLHGDILGKFEPIDEDTEE
jgi:hypothetical protein